VMRQAKACEQAVTAWSRFRLRHPSSLTQAFSARLLAW
jgi:hypothetical protein